MRAQIGIDTNGFGVYEVFKNWKVGEICLLITYNLFSFAIATCFYVR